MVDFPLRAVVTAVTRQAMTAIDRLKGALTGISEYTEASSQKQKAAWRRVQNTIAGVTAVATGLVAAMVATSPELAAAIAEIKFQFQEVTNALGNELSPVVEAFIPIAQQLTNWFLALPQPVKQFIALTIALTAAVGALTIAVIALSAASLPIIAVILGIAAAIAAVIVVWNNWNDIVDYAKENIVKFSGIVYALTILFGPIVLAVLAIITIFKNLGNIIDWVSDRFEALINFITTAASNIGSFISASIEAAVESVRGVLNSIIIWLNDNVIGFINDTIIPAVNSILPKKLEIGLIGDIPSFLTGGIVPGSGAQLIEAHGGEEILHTGDPRHRRNRGSTNVGGVTIIQHFRFSGQTNTRQVMRAAKQGVREGSKNLQLYTRSGYSS